MKTLISIFVCIPFIVNAQITGTLLIDGKLRESADPWSTVLKIIPKEDKVNILNLVAHGYLLVKYQEIEGYVLDVYFKRTEEFKNYIKDKKNEERKEHIKYLLDTFGKEITDKILNKQYWIGMTTEMASNSLGTPNDINQSVGSWGTHEQWIYSKLYLYFENGKLTSYQK